VAVRYEVVGTNRLGKQLVHEYASEELAPGDVVYVDGRFWLVVELDGTRATTVPAGYRITLRHPDGREEHGIFRRWRADAPHIGHMFSTVEDGAPIAWEILERTFARDDAGEPFVDFVAQRDFGEIESLPNHELEHALDASDSDVPAGVLATLERAQEGGFRAELVALDAGEEPDWEGAARFLDSLVLDEIGDELLEQCGVDPNSDPRDAWLATVQERLRADLAAFRGDIESNHDEIEEWDFLDGRVFVSVGSLDDESDPNSGHGWMCRLVDSDVLGAGGFERIRKSSFLPS